MTEREVAVIVMLLPMILMTILAIRILIGSDQEDRIERSTHVPVTIENEKRKKDRQ